MRFAYVSVDPGIPVFGTKGASVHIQEVVRELLSRGHQVRVYTSRRGKDVPADLTGLEVIEVPVEAKDPAQREEQQRHVAAELAEQILADGADAVYERYSLFSTAAATVTRRGGIPAVLEVNAPLIDEQRTHRVLVDAAGAQAALLTQAHAAAATVCVSDPVRDWVRRETSARDVHTVANGVSVTRIKPQPEAPGIPVVTFVGTLKPWHGVADLITAASLARQPWRLRIVGDGPQRAALEAQAAQLGIDVDFRGAVAPEQIPQHLAGSAIAVAPYPDLGSEEQQYFSPLKVYEYLAAGLPVVASAVGQIPEVLAGVGELTPPSNPAALAEAIDALAADPARRAELGARGRAQAVERHSWAGAVEQILELAGIDG